MKRVLFVHCFPQSAVFGESWFNRWLDRVSTTEFQTISMSLDVGFRGGRMPFDELDRRYRYGNRALWGRYEQLFRATETVDAIVNFGAANLHPDILDELPVPSALAFYDDPESTREYSRPVAAHHDICLLGNVAELDSYKAFGARRVEWWPLGFRSEDVHQALNPDDFLGARRDIPVVLMCERQTHYRRRRVDKYASCFPDGVFRGPGWPAGFLAEAERVPTLLRSRIGINIHNSTGPINFRTYYLPANGVLQLCDNKAHLGRVFDLGREVIGFDSIDEAIDLTRYYLSHESERVEIAFAGYVRARRDYNERTVFDRAMNGLFAVARRERPYANNLSTLLTLRRVAEHRRHRRVASLGAAWAVTRLRLGALSLFRRTHRLFDNFLARLESPLARRPSPEDSNRRAHQA